MIISYLKDLFNRIKNSKIITKVFIGLFIFIEIFILFISFYKVDYNVTTPGFIQDASNTIVVDTDNEKGFIGTVSVITYNKISLLKYWLSKNDLKLDLEKREDNDMSDDDKVTYGIISKRIAINNAIIVAYDKAKEIDETIYLAKEYKGLIVSYIVNNNANIVADDIITEMNGIKINSYNEFKNEAIKLLGDKNNSGSLKAGDIINFKCINSKGAEVERTLAVRTTDSKYSIENKLGMQIEEYYELSGDLSSPKFTIDYNIATDSRGGSGGAMMALSVYNSLVEDDVTKGKVIAGTGTIAIDGTVGEIGAIKQKTIRAYISGVDLFLVDSINYDEAIKTCQDLGYDSNFVKKIGSFDDILNVLKEVGTNE